MMSADNDEGDADDEFFLVFANSRIASTQSLNSSGKMSEYERDFLAHVVSTEKTLPVAVQDTMHAIQALHEPSDAKTIQDAMVELTELADNEDALKLMEDQRVHEEILEGMNRLLSFIHLSQTPGENKLSDDSGKSFWVQWFQVGCTLLSKLTKLSKKLGRAIVKSDAPRLIIRTMNSHSQEIPVQVYGLEALGVFAYTEFGCRILLSPDLDVLSQVIVAMSTYQDSVEVQRACCFCLKQLLAKDNEQKKKLMKNKEYELVMQAYKKHVKNSDLVKEVCSLIKTLCVTVADKNAFINDDLHQLVIKSLKINHFSVNPEIWVAGAGLLSMLSTDERIRKYLVSENFHTDCLTMTIKYMNHEGVQAVSFELFDYLASLVFEDTAYCEEWQWMKQVYLALSQHREDADVQMAALNVLCKLLEFKPYLQCQIGDATEEKQEPIHTLCLGAILIHGSKHAGVFTAACSAIFWIAAANERLQGLLMEKNTHIGVYDCMPYHMDNATALEAACKAIRGFCIFNPATKSAVFSDDRSFNFLVQALVAFSQKELQLQIEAISVLACLADLEIVRHLCLVKKVHRKILKSMYFHPESEILQECALEALAILAAAEGAVQLLNEASAMHQALETMKNHPTSYGIQKKGLVVVQLLISDFEPENPSFYRVIANVIKTAMNTHNDDKNNVSVQIEGCVAMQLMAEKSEEATHALIDTQTHQCLYYIFETFNDLPGTSTCLGCSGQCYDFIPQPPNNSIYTGLYDLATECLHVLGWVRHQTDRLLLSACQKGLLKVVACLVELGADINVGSGYNTPLGYACQQENEELVQYLLEQGVANDVQTPLKWSLKKQTDNITGMLLKQMGFDKEAGIVSWSGLDLGNISPKWLYPTLLGWQLVKKNDEMGRTLVVKVKKSQKKRERRISQEKEELLQNLGTRMKLRYQPEKEAAKDVSPQRSPRVGSVQLVTIPGSVSPVAANRFPNRMKQRRGSLFPFTKRKLAKDIGSHKFESLNVETMGRGGRWVVKRNSDTALLRMDGQDDSCSYVYIQWPEEMQEWRRESITGCNVPFSPNDPRQVARDSRPQPSQVPQTIEWSRKAPHSVYKIRNKRSSVPCEAIEVKLVSEGTSDSESCKSVSTKTETKEGDEDTAAVGTDLDTSRDEDEMSQCSEGHQERMGRLQRSRADTIDTIPEKISEVKVLDLSSNNIGDLSVLVKESGTEIHIMFKYIEKLDFSHNHLQEFPSKLFKCLPLLQDLDLKMNNLTVFPVEALACRKLHSIDVSGNQIDDLSQCTIPNISKSMKELNLSHNQLHTYPLWIADYMPNLTKLELDGNKIETLPSTILKLKDLELLSLSHNYIKNIPDCFFKECTHLETLLLSHNELASLPKESVSQYLQRLQTLKLSSNNLSAKEPFYIPKIVLALPSLKVLDLSSNDLNGLPDPTHWKTNVLRELLVNSNNITVLDLGPKDCKKWLQMERLNISRNKLKELPKSIDRLPNLTSLDFSHNDQITTLPDELGKLSKVWEMPLKGLNLDLDDGIQRGEVKHLIGYLHERLKKAEEYFRIKVMILGLAGRGKTTLLRSLMKVKQPESSIATVGILVKDWIMKTDRISKGRTVHYKLSTWDFAGQEEFYSTHQCFLSNRSLYLVVCNITKGPSEVETLKPWLLNIQARAPGCPVIIVATHKDLLPEDERDERINEMTKLIQEMCSKPGFPKVKAFECVNGTRDNRQIEALRMKIKTVIEEFKVKGQHVMGQKVPASYIKLENIIEQARGNQKGRFPVIGRPELDRMSSELSLESDELQQAVRFLHESGVLLHYDDASLQLRSLYFIDPEWLCRMFAQVVTVREINPFITDGVMKKADMQQLFKGRRVGEDVSFTFPTQLIPQYLRLLAKFEIALPINEDDLLIPCRLPQEKPSFGLPKGFGKDIPVTHRYYEMLYYIPIGFWSRLLTRLLTFTDDMTLEMPGKYSNVSTTYWSEGIFVHWSEQTYFLIETQHEPVEMIDVCVPATASGGRILGHIVDHIDALVEEWYPGLTEKDPMGDEALQIRIPCPMCVDRSDPHLYTLDELINQAKLSDSISCPNHRTDVSLHLLAPDVMLTDLESKFHIDHTKFKFMQSPEFLLGDGSFGAVYRAEYKQQSVAVKVYNCVGDISPHKFMRQEVTILRRLQHPSLLQMLGAEIKPMVLVLELAPLGSLGTLLKQGYALSRGLQHRIATQVAEGLLCLHRYRIIYRDMKPDNVLIFNLSLGVLINAKIADYGISRFAAPYGFSSKEGTPGFRAPEVARGETYEFQADVYSYGITLYTLVTGGHHPFHDLTFRCQLDEAVTKPVGVDPITNKNCPPWPDMEDIMDHCLVQVPEQRLNSQQVFDLMNCPETTSLLRVLPVSEGQTIECIAVRNHGNEAEAWIGSGESDGAQLSWFSLTSSNSKLGGIHIQHTRILCITAVSNSTVIVGTQSGQILVYDTWTHMPRHTMSLHSSSVLSLLHYSSVENGMDIVLAGLSNGTLLTYDTSMLQVNPTAECEVIELGSDTDPVKCLTVRNGKLFVSCGSMIVVVSLQSLPLLVETRWLTEEESVPNQTAISNMVIGKDLYLSKRNCSNIEMWNIDRKKLNGLVDISRAVLDVIDKEEESLKEKRKSSFSWNTSDTDLSAERRINACKITSMMLQNSNTLWVGTRGGFIVLVDPISASILHVTHRHERAVRAIVCVKPRCGRRQKLKAKAVEELTRQTYPSDLAESRPQEPLSLVLTGGGGYRNKCTMKQKRSDDYGFITVWDTNLKQHIKTIRELTEKRKELMNKNNPS